MRKPVMAIQSYRSEQIVTLLRHMSVAVAYPVLPYLDSTWLDA
jgi:hypothetical protein